MADSSRNVTITVLIESKDDEHHVIVCVEGHEYERVGPYEDLDAAKRAAAKAVEVLTKTAQEAGIQQPKPGPKLS